MGRVDLAGVAHLELVSGVVQLHPEDVMAEAMLSGWRAQQVARGLRERTIVPRERLVRRFLAFTGEYPWQWQAAHVDEWIQSLTGEKRLAPSTIRGYQTDLRLFSEYLCDGRYGWAVACEKEFGPGAHPVPICHEWNTIAHLNDYEGSPEARPFTRQELQEFLDYADEQVDRAVTARRKGGAGCLPGRHAVQGHLCLGAAAHRDVPAGCGRLGPQPGRPGVRPVRHAACPLWQGSARAAAAAPQRALGDGLGGGGGGRLRGKHPAEVRLR
jgi:Phage integrase, N-terminal SAM-like domain